MVVEGFRRGIESKKVEEYEQRPEAVPPSVAEILADPAYSELLSLALEKQGKDDLRRKILRREILEKQDFEDLESYRQLIKNAKEYSREITQRLTPETIKIIAGASPEFNNLVAQIGINKINEFLEAYLPRLYVIDKNNFENLYDKIKDIKRAEQELQNIDNSLKEACRKYGISESELAQIYERIGSEQGTQEGEQGQEIQRGNKEIHELLYKRLNILQKVWDKLSGGGLTKEKIEELNKVKEIEGKIKEIHERLAEVGKMIADTIFGTEEKEGIAEARVFLTKALYSQIEKLGGGISFKEAVYSEEDLKREWEEYQREVTKEGGAFDGKDRNDPVVKQELRNGFMSYLRRKRFGNKMGGVIDVLMGMVANWLATK
jgi:hypothetical protein